jgi:hypothetical protein
MGTLECGRNHQAESVGAGMAIGLATTVGLGHARDSLADANCRLVTNGKPISLRVVRTSARLARRCRRVEREAQSGP